MKKQTYRVRPGYHYGIGNRYGPGDIVELTKHEFGSQHDRLELVADDEKPPKPPPADADPLKSINTLKEWLETNPDAADVRNLLAQEQDGRNRQGALDLLTDYLEVGSDG